MADATTAAQRQPARPQGVLVRLVLLPFQLFGALCGSLLLSMLIECVGMHVFWPEEGWHHAQNLLTHELDQLSDHYRHSLLIQEPGQSAHRWVAYAHEALWVQSGAREQVREVSARAQAAASVQPKRLTQHIGRALVHLESYAKAAGFIALTFLVRLIVLGLTLPLFLLAAVTGLVDGLVRRDVRRFGAGHESGFIFHRARASIVPLGVLPCVTYLIMPVSVHPLWVLLPGAMVIGVVVNITAGAFKKYL